MAESTKYLLLKKCLQCFNINPKESKTCSACGYLFLGEADFDEYERAMDKFIIKKK